MSYRNVSDMKVLSIDVGIRNLALCVMEVEENDEADAPRNLTISFWKIINLLETPTYPCSGRIGKSEKECPVTAKFTGPDLQGEPLYFCGSHKSLYTVPELAVTDGAEAISQCTQHHCAGLDSTCKAKVRRLVGGVGYCSRHADKVVKKHQKSHVLKVISVKKCGEADLFDIKSTIWTLLDEQTHLLKVDKVVIENQPGLKNPTMKSIAETLYNYFLCRGIVDKQKTGSEIAEVKYVSPSNKMKLCPEENLDVQGTANKGQKYRKTKAYSIEKVRSLLTEAVDRQRFNTNPKKDDLADCLLQGLYVLSTLGCYDKDTKVSTRM